MQVKSIANLNAPREHSAILLTFIKLPFVFKTFILSVFEWLLKTGLPVDDSAGQLLKQYSGRLISPVKSCITLKFLLWFFEVFLCIKV